MVGGGVAGGDGGDEWWKFMLYDVIFFNVSSTISTGTTKMFGCGAVEAQRSGV